MDMKLVVGLGNPGREYEGTRHNAGFAVIDAFVAGHRFPGWKTVKKVHGFVGRGRVGAEEIILLKPATFMNASGEAVAAALSFFKIKPRDLIVVHDELAFPLGTVRLAANGSAGGHNGLASVIAAVGSESFARLRVGIGPETARKIRLDSYVLQKFGATELARFEAAVADAVEALDKTLSLGLKTAMNAINSKGKD
jgi:PTH1 family peptidyl-tRNA hydrolase